MAQVADNVVEPRKNEVGSQRTEEYGTETVTVTVAPPDAVAGLGLTDGVAPLIPAEDRYVFTALVTEVVVAPERMATRAPSRAAFVITC
jgi:hypothetical protein